MAKTGWKLNELKALMGNEMLQLRLNPIVAKNLKNIRDYIAEDREECSFIWDNFYDEEEMINEYDLTVFVQEEGDLFRRYCETHYQRAYSLETVKSLIEKAGMEVLAIYDAFTYNKPKPDSERVYFVAREHGKKTV